MTTTAPLIVPAADAPLLVLSKFPTAAMEKVKSLMAAVTAVSNGQVRVYNPGQKVPWSTQPWFVVDNKVVYLGPLASSLLTLWHGGYLKEADPALADVFVAPAHTPPHPRPERSTDWASMARRVLAGVRS